MEAMRVYLRKFAALAVCLLLTGCAEKPVVLRQAQTANSSNGSYWEYELSAEDVLTESEYYETSFLGPGYTQHWEFEAVGEGNATIIWKHYTAGKNLDTQHSYCATYQVKDHHVLLIGERAYQPEETHRETT
jgi:predicted secreted protein